jgi:heme/copper-type cytochrome/quinol oxidase subunit 1
MMRGFAKAFFATAVVYGLLGMLLGLDMAMRHDHAELPTHAHIMVIGWLSFAIFGFFYHLLGQAVPPLLASLHFWLAQASLAVLVVALWLIYSGRPEFDPLAAVGAMGYAASFAIFAAGAFIALRTPTPSPP